MESLVEVQNVTMKFNMSSENINSLKEYAIKFVKKKLFYEEFWALTNLNFTINKGEVFGVVGKNGAGKSTLLKILAGVIKPSSGTIQVKGSIAPLIELGAGFDPDLSARENIFLNGAMLGHSRKYIKNKFDEIVDFSELDNFLNVPLKNYSSGMYARLGFSIATIVNPDILMVDEILSVGDYQFQLKCEEKIKKMIQEGTTVILVSHSLDQVEELCSRVLWLESGQIKEIGAPSNIIEKFKLS